MHKLYLYNTLSRKKVAFRPISEDHIRLYACGPTVYSYAHIGNARMAVVFDVLDRLLKYLYPKVTYVSNITDVDDKIIKAAQQNGEDISLLTQKYTRIYNQDMKALGVRRPDVQPKATDHIEDMVSMISDLIGNGHAYEAAGHVMFHVPSYESYGILSGRSREDQIAGARVEIAPHKKDPADFVLWKPSDPDQPGWESPWGRGRPGWHIECSVMAEQHLGLPFDIHGGGADLKFPHHENEIAQSCCAHGYEDDPSAFARYWVHNGFLTVEGDKMSKSLGNVLLVHDLLKNSNMKGPVIRLALLSSHYRQPLDWNEQCVHQSETLYEKICGALERLDDVKAQSDNEMYPPMLRALCDDLNTPLAFSKLNELVKEINKAPKKDLPHLKTLLENSIDILGIEFDTRAFSSSAKDMDNKEAQELLEERQKARAEKDFQKADAIRDKLKEMGLSVEDTSEGPKLRKIS